MLPGDGNLWWAGATNTCVDYALAHAETSEDYLLTLNNDLIVGPDYLALLMDVVRRHPHAIIASSVCDITTNDVVSSGHRLSWLTSKFQSVEFARDCLPDEPDLCRVTHAPGRGTLIPLSAFKDIGKFDFDNLPHYAADYDFTLRASRAGYEILISDTARVYSHVEATGMSIVMQERFWSGFWNYLTSIKSPANLRTRFFFAVRNCPIYLLPSYLMLDIFFVLGGYFKRYFLCNGSNRKS